MKRKSVLACSLGILVILVLMAAPAQSARADPGYAYVRVFNANEDVKLDVAFGADTVFSHVPPGAFSTYLKIPSGTYTVTVSGVAPITTYPVPAQAAFLTGQRYTLYLIATTPYCGGSMESCFDVFEAPPRPPAGYARLRMIDPGTVTNGIDGRRLIADGSQPRTRLLPVSSLYWLCVNSGAYAVDDRTDCFPDLRLQSRERYTIWMLLGSYRGPVIERD